jgi:hypothetical protein
MSKKKTPGRPQAAANKLGFEFVLVCRINKGLRYEEFKIQREDDEFILQFEKESRIFTWATTSRHHEDHRRQAKLFLLQVKEEKFKMEPTKPIDRADT